MMASDALSRLANPRAILAEPTSGATTTGSLQLLLPEVVHEHRRRVQVVHRQVEEPLHLVLVEIHAEHPVRAGHRHHVRHELGADGDARLVLAVLPRVPEVGNDRR